MKKTRLHRGKKSLRFERLERKELLAITAFVTDDGDLIVRSPDNAANEVAIFQVPQAGVAAGSVSGSVSASAVAPSPLASNLDPDLAGPLPAISVEPGDYIVMGSRGANGATSTADDTFVNGSTASPNYFAVFSAGDVSRNVIIDTRHGADVVVLGNVVGQAAEIPTANLQALYLAAGFSGNSELFIGNNLEIRTREGVDQIGLSAVEVLNDIVIDTGNATPGTSDEVQVIWSTVGNEMTVRGGSGNDTIRLYQTLISHNFTAYGNAGNDTINIGSSSVSGDINVHGSIGDDTMLLDDVLVGSDVNLYGHAGNETVELSFLAIGDDLNIETHSGGTTETVLESVFIDDVVVGDVARIITSGIGADFDQINIGGGETSVDNGKGLRARELRIETGGSQDRVTIADSRVAANTYIHTGGGNDFVRFEGNNVFWNVDVLLDSGDDTLTFLATNWVSRNANFWGGTGNDVVNGQTNMVGRGRRPRVSFFEFT